MSARYIKRMANRMTDIAATLSAAVPALVLAASVPGNTQVTDPTAGWTQVPFTYEIQHPYDLQTSDRYSYDSATNTHVFWVLHTDKPHLPPPNHTAPRTEMRFFNEYSSGQHMFDADVWVVAGTDNTNIMQVFLTSQIRVFSPQNGNARETFSHGPTSGTSLYTDLYGKWVNLKVWHDADAHVIRYYFDNQLKYTKNDNHSGNWYFKCGVYTVNTRSEAHFRNIRYWRKGAGVTVRLPMLSVSAGHGPRLLYPGDDPLPRDARAAGPLFDVNGRMQAPMVLRPAAPLLAR